MAEKYYREVVDDSGNKTYEEVEVQVDLSSIPNEEFYKDTRYRQVADRDAQRRLKIKELQTQLESLNGEKDDSSNDTTVPVDNKTELDLDTIYLTVKERLEREQAETQRVKAERETKMNELITKHKLKKDALDILMESTNPEKVAAKLGSAGYVFEDSQSGETGDEGDATSILMKRVYQKLNLGE